MIDELLDDMPTVAPPSLASLLRPDRIKLRSGKLNPKSELAREIYELWGLHPAYMKHVMTVKGTAFVREEFEMCKKAAAKNPVALFQWRLKQKPNLPQ